MASAPGLEGLDSEFGVDKFLQIAAWSDGTVENMSDFADQHGLTFPLIAADLHGRFERDGGIPSFMLIGPGHELLMVDEGHPSHEQIQAAIDEYF